MMLFADALDLPTNAICLPFGSSFVDDSDSGGFAQLEDLGMLCWSVSNRHSNISAFGAGGRCSSGNGAGKGSSKKNPKNQGFKSHSGHFLQNSSSLPPAAPLDTAGRPVLFQHMDCDCSDCL